MRHNPPVDDGSLLLRPEALEAARAGPCGEIVLLPGAWSRWTGVAALALVAAAVALLALGSYTRRSTVPGQLMPSEGLIRITAPQSGVVVERPVREGQSVRKGDRLYVVSTDREGPDAAAFQQLIARQIDGRRQSLEDELGRLAETHAQEQQQLQRRLDAVRAERRQIDAQVQLMQTRVRSAEEAMARYQAVFAQGFVSRDQLQSRETELADARERLLGLRREALALEREATSSQRDSDTARTRLVTRRAELERAVLQARQEYTEVEARRRIVVTAPADGRITLLQADIGQSVEAQKALAHVVPARSTLVARLYVPSRAAGFVRPGMPVRLRYDAYPYQTFGQHQSTVESVSSAAVTPEETRGLPWRPEGDAVENLFAVHVRLPNQALREGLPLQAGMRLEADLLHETRALYQWVLEPLYAVRERLKGT